MGFDVTLWASTSRLRAARSLILRDTDVAYQNMHVKIPLSIQSAEFFAFECSLFEVLWSASTPDRFDKPV